MVFIVNPLFLNKFRAIFRALQMLGIFAIIT